MWQRPQALVWRALFAAVALGLLGERAHAFVVGEPTDFDDAYMFARYAHNLLDGHGVAWNPGGPATYGVTSLGHLLVVTALHALVPGHDDGLILRLASASAAVALLVSMGVVAARAAGVRRGASAGGSLGVIAMVVACAYTDAFWFHARTGMDTMLAALAVLLVAALALRLRGRPTVSNACLCAVGVEAALLARPDLVIVAVGVPACVLAWAVPPPRRRIALVFAAAAVGVVAVDLALRARLLGSAVPLPLYAKRPGAYTGFAGEYGWNPFLFLRVFCVLVAPFLLVTLAAAGKAAVRPVLALLVPAVLTVTASFFENQIMGHLGRFYLPLLPLFAVAAALGLTSSGRSEGRRRALAVRGALAGACVLVGYVALGRAGAWFEAQAERVVLVSVEPRGATMAGPPLPDLDTWRAGGEVAELLAAAPAGTRVAMSEHGLPGARARHVIIDDVLGLHDPVFAHDFSAARLFARRPDALWLPHPDHTRMLRDILDHPIFRADYIYYPDAFSYGFALRRSGPRFAALDKLFRARFAVAYPGRTPEEVEARYKIAR